MIIEGRWVKKKRSRKAPINPDDIFTLGVLTKIPEKSLMVSEEQKRLTEMHHWCRDQFGAVNDRWNYRYHPFKGRREVVFLFATHVEATAFTIRWR